MHLACYTEGITNSLKGTTVMNYTTKKVRYNKVRMTWTEYQEYLKGQK